MSLMHLPAFAEGATRGKRTGHNIQTDSQMDTYVRKLQFLHEYIGNFK